MKAQFREHKEILRKEINNAIVNFEISTGCIVRKLSCENMIITDIEERKNRNKVWQTKVDVIETDMDLD